MKPDIPLLNQRSRKERELLSAQLIAHEAAGLLKGTLKFAELQRIHELRKSCGVESEETATVHVRLPLRYAEPPK